jgi:two-component system chemotaxis response regulator CheY
MKVLIVDDNARMRTLIRSVLIDVAQEFVECASGEEAVLTFPVERPDWTVMDVVMPGMDGLTAMRRIIAESPEARIVIVTQHVSLKLRESALLAGATGFVSKEGLTGLEGIIIGSGGIRNA